MTDSPLRQATPLRSRGAQAGWGAVRVICGVHTLEAHVAGRTVEEVRAALGQALNVSPAAVAVVNGAGVGEGHVLREGEQLEFVRLAGEKGQFMVCRLSFVVVMVPGGRLGDHKRQTTNDRRW